MVTTILLPSGRRRDLRGRDVLVGLQPILRAEYGRGPVRCLCTGGEGVPMAICRLRAGVPEGAYYLRSYPSAPEHRSGCPLTATHEPARHREHSQAWTFPVLTSEAPSHHSGAVRRPVQSPDELLAALFERAAIPDPLPQGIEGSSQAIMARLRHAAAQFDTSLGPLDQSLWCVPSWGGMEPQGQVQERIASVSQAGHWLTLIAEPGTLEIPAEGKGGFLFLKGLSRDFGWRAWWPMEVAQLVRIRNQPAFDALADPANRVFFCAYVVAPPADRIAWIRAAGLLTRRRAVRKTTEPDS